MAVTKVVVVGAGVIGLSIAYVLSKHKHINVSIVAKHMPGDYDIEYASPWAGANYWPVGKPGSSLQKFEQATWPELERICREVPEAGIHFQKSKIYGRMKDAGTATGLWFEELVKEDAWFKDSAPNFHVLSKSELPHGYDTGQCVKNGVTIRRGVLSHISEASMHHPSGDADIIVNCTGLSASKLGGVMDASVYPGRGQIVLVRNESDGMLTTSGTDHGSEEATYIMQRALGGGTVLGGCLQHGSWDSQPDPNLAQRIMQRSIELCPSLTPKTGRPDELSIIRHGVGLRPMRKDGPRIETEKIGASWVVHNYGHAGYGFQSGWGSAFAAEELVLKAVQEHKGMMAKL